MTDRTKKPQRLWVIEWRDRCAAVAIWTPILGTSNRTRKTGLADLKRLRPQFIGLALRLRAYTREHP